ncbi:MAG: hypothetical protein ACK5IQ_03670 [Bacteroidales bacterium]
MQFKIRINDATSKPHTDNKGIIWTKNGSDKRKVTSKEEIARLLQNSGNLSADESLISSSSIDDCNTDKFLDYFVKNWEATPEELGINLLEALQNTFTIKDGRLTLGGLLFFARIFKNSDLPFA